MLCKQCGVFPRKHHRTVCQRCQWARHSDKMKMVRDTDAFRKLVNNSAQEARNKANAVLLSRFGDGKRFVCQRCGFSSLRKRQFSLHHLATKRGNFTQYFRHNNFEEKLSEEPVIFICENCHRLEHRPKENSIKAAIIKKCFGQQRCSICCNDFTTSQLDFHHISEKDNGMSYLIHRLANTKDFNNSKTFAKACEEALTCQILCACCHQLVHSL